MTFAVARRLASADASPLFFASLVASGRELFDYVRQYKYQDGEDNFTDNFKSSMRGP